MENKQVTDQLVACWRNAERFVVLDACRDAGSNFLSAWTAWRADPARPSQLHYLAIVGSTSPFITALQSGSHSSESASLIEELRGVLPPLVSGFHRLLLDDERIVLTLMVGDIDACMPQINASVNAFFLDATLTVNIAKRLSKLAAQDAALVCGNISNDTQQILRQAGFDFISESSHADVRAIHARFAPHWRQPLSAEKRERKAIVIGAGLAGSAACERLAVRGWQLALIERHAQPAQEASGNLAGIFMPLLSKDDNPTARLTRAAYFFAHQLWQRIGGIGNAFSGEACGVLQLARDAAHAQVQQQMMQRWQYPAEFVQWLQADEAARLLGHAVPNGGCFFAQGGWANPAGVCRALLNACADKLETHFSQSVLALERIDDQWQVYDANGNLIAQAPIVILANGADALSFSQARLLPLASVRGQVTNVAAAALPDLPVVVCREGYLTRTSQGMCSIGASYDQDDDPLPQRSSDVENCARLNQMLPGILLDLDHVTYQSRVAFRCVSTDRLPLVGALPDMAAAFRGDRLRDVPRLPGLYGLLGYASRGLIWSSFAAELLAAQLEGEPLPLESDLADALDPARFLLKMHRKNIAPDTK
ncbi:MAG TPA: FAD-dependent 5-carboxymethylaminomethyl-2-thiouridine(34) oxidoreductase MnmC [Burkholderiaceae bacterium]